MKRVLFFALCLPSSLLAAKGDLAAPQKMAAPASRAEEKPTPDTGKRVLHLQLKK